MEFWEKKFLDRYCFKQQLTMLAIKKLFQVLSRFWMQKTDSVGFNRIAQLCILLLLLWTFRGSFLIRKSFRKTHGLLVALIFHHMISSCEAIWKKILCTQPHIYWSNDDQNHGGHSLLWCSDAAKSIPEPVEASSDVTGSGGGDISNIFHNLLFYFDFILASVFCNIAFP